MYGTNSLVITASPVETSPPPPKKKIPTTKIWAKQILNANNTDDWWCRYEPFCNTDDMFEIQLYSKNRYVTHKSTYFPPWGGRVLPYILYRYMYEPLWTLWFISSLLWNRVYKSESLGPRIGYHFQDTDQLFKDFRLDTNFQLKIALCQFVDKNDYWENHRFKLEHDEVLKGWFLNEWVRI